MTKKCSNCFVDKPVFEFCLMRGTKDNLHCFCSVCRSIKRKEYRAKNKNKINENLRKYRNINSEKLNARARERWRTEKSKIYRKQYYIKNKIKILKTSSIYNKTQALKISQRLKIKRKLGLNIVEKRWKRQNSKTINFKIISNIRQRIKNKLKLYFLKKNNKTEKYLGCNILQFKKHIENQFSSKINRLNKKIHMNWENYGNNEDQWCLDHILPCASFYFLEESEVYKCFHYTNYQPLWNNENYLKGDLLPDGSRARHEIRCLKTEKSLTKLCEEFEKL